MPIVGLFLPSQHGTKINFIRAILQNKKQALKQTVISHIVVPKYEELSVKNLYEDALSDPEVGGYLPELTMNSNRLPERDFFFGILGTIKPDYLKQIINDAHKNRYEAGNKDQEKNYIMIKDKWLEELTKHPFLSSKMACLIHVERPGRAIFLLKERTKFVRAKRDVKKYDLSKRLYED